MGRLNGEILLAEKKVRVLRKQLRRDEKIPRRTKNKIELVFKMALRYIKWTERFGRLSGKYEECYPDLARGICETFYADDTELAACFRVSPALIERWKQHYPDFKNKSRAGKSRFIRQEGSDVCRQRWFRLRYATVARNICKEFKPAKRQLNQCFNVKAETWKEFEEWMKEDHYVTVYTRLEEIHHHIHTKTLDRICMVFNPNSEQLARWFNCSVEKSQEYLTAWKLEQEKSRQYMEGFRRSISGSPKADNGANHEKGTEKQE